MRTTTKESLKELKKVLLSNSSQDEIRQAIREVYLTKPQGAISTLMNQVKGAWGLGYGSRHFAFRTKPVFSHCSEQELKDLVLKSLDIAITGSEWFECFDVVTVSIDFEGKTISVDEVFSVDYEVTLYKSKDTPPRIFAEFIRVASFVISSKIVEIELDLKILEKSDQSSILQSIMRFKPF